MLDPRPGGRARVRRAPPGRGGGARGGAPRRDAGLLREAADDHRVEGSHQRPAPEQLLCDQRGAQARPRTHPRSDPARRAHRNGIPGSDHPAVSRRPGVLGGDRCADDREPDPSSARLRASPARRGFKNSTPGSVQVAVDAVRSARSSHIFLSVTKAGRSAIFSTKGNRDCHVILRGGDRGPNYDSQSVRSATAGSRTRGFPPG